MLQERLMQLGYYSEKINGYFGMATRTAVEQFRLSNNLPESSVVDTEAFNLIFSAYAVDDGNLPFETGEPYYTVSPAPSPVTSSLPMPAASPTPTLPPAADINAVAETNCNCNCVRRTDRSPDTVAKTHTDAKADADTVACANPDSSTRTVTRA